MNESTEESGAIHLGWGWINQRWFEMDDGSWWTPKRDERMSAEDMEARHQRAKGIVQPAGSNQIPYLVKELGELTGVVEFLRFKDGESHYFIKLDEVKDKPLSSVMLDWCDAGLFIGKRMTLDGELHHNDTSGIPVLMVVSGFISADPDCSCGKGGK